MQIDNTTNYATQELSMRIASMAIRIGILRQQADELKAANQILKKQVDSYKTKEGSEKPHATDHQSGSHQQRGQSKQ